MTKLTTRLEVLEDVRSTGEKSMDKMTDAELVFVITGDRTATITDQQLERIARGRNGQA